MILISIGIWGGENTIPTKWNGFYTGIQTGGILGNANVDYHSQTPNNFSETHGLDVNGFLTGIFAGYNWVTTGNWLFGIEGEWNYISADDKGIVVNSTTGASRYPHQSKVEQKWDASLRLRTGLITENYLTYLLMLQEGLRGANSMKNFIFLEDPSIKI